MDPRSLVNHYPFVSTPEADSLSDSEKTRPSAKECNPNPSFTLSDGTEIVPSGISPPKPAVFTPRLAKVKTIRKDSEMKRFLNNEI